MLQLHCYCSSLERFLKPGDRLCTMLLSCHQLEGLYLTTKVWFAGLSTGSALLVLAITKIFSPDFFHTPMTLLANFTAIPVEVGTSACALAAQCCSCLSV